MTNPLTALWGDREEKRAWKAMEARAKALPADYRASYRALRSYLWKFTANNGKDILAALAIVLSLFEVSASAGRSVSEVTGRNLAAFAGSYVPGARPAYESSWRTRLNRSAPKSD